MDLIPTGVCYTSIGVGGCIEEVLWPIKVTDTHNGNEHINLNGVLILICLELGTSGSWTFTAESYDEKATADEFQ